MKSKKVALIVAHPDDETLWAGGTILIHPDWKCFVISLSRANDPDRSPRFFEALKVLHAEGVMGNLDDGPEQNPLDDKEVEKTILDLLPSKSFDLVISHSPFGEYTRHLRHEETGKAVFNLWNSGKIKTRELCFFAYSDEDRKHHPLPMGNASIFHSLSKNVWERKFTIITDIYGFEKRSWEAETTPRAEAFWQFSDPEAVNYWLQKERGTL